MGDNGGIDTEKSYPYEGEDDECRYNAKFRGATDVGFMDVDPGNEAALKTAIATQGPCSLAIGYGVDEVSGEAYWLIKNSWGTSWGHEGYVKIARNEDNMCGVASAASYPLVKTLG